MNRLPAAVLERFTAFDCEGSTCLGVLSAAATGAPPAMGVVVVVGGPQYRVGSHRQFALLARALAAAGIPTLRFDYRGMGDSEGEPRTFETIDADIRSAVDTLVSETGVSKLVLWGLCDGASAAFMYGWRDPRVAGIVALNTWARSTQGEASARLKHYYLQRLVSREFWRKALSGQFKARAAAGELAAKLRNAAKADPPATAETFLKRMEDGWRRFRRPTLLLLSGNDLTAREFEDWIAGDRRRKALASQALTQIATFSGADHTFSDRASRDAVAARTIEWITRLRDSR